MSALKAFGITAAILGWLTLLIIIPVTYPENPPLGITIAWAWLFLGPIFFTLIYLETR